MTEQYTCFLWTSRVKIIYQLCFVCLLPYTCSHIYILTLTVPLQGILLSDDTTDSDTDSDDSDFSLSREELHNMLRLHRYTRQHQSKFHLDREVQTHACEDHTSLSHWKYFQWDYRYTQPGKFVLQLHQYQYYSTGLLSTHDPFYEQHRHLLGPKKKKIKDEKKFKGKGKSNVWGLSLLLLCLRWQNRLKIPFKIPCFLF